MLADYHELLQNLEEGIILVSNNSVNFSNKIFLDILKATKMVDDKSSTIPEDVMDLKIFKLFRAGDMTDLSISRDAMIKKHKDNTGSSGDERERINSNNINKKKLIRKNSRGSNSSAEEGQPK